MKSTKIFALLATSAALLIAVNVSAKEIKIGTNNTAYSTDDVQKLAATAVQMGVKEPVSLASTVGKVTVSGSSSTQCVFKVSEGAKPQIQGMSCK